MRAVERRVLKHQQVLDRWNEALRSCNFGIGDGEDEEEMKDDIPLQALRSTL